MAIQIQGNNGVVAEVDGTSFRALRTSRRPVDFGALGAYRATMRTGVMAAGLAANAEIFQFRWTDATRLCAITSLRLAGAGSIVAFAAGITIAEAMIARSWTVAGGGGAALTVAANNQKLRTAMGTTLVGEIRGSTTAALTAGTKTLDANPIGSQVSSVQALAGVPLWVPGPLFEADAVDSQPIVLAQNEGVIVRATVPATGTWTAAIDVSWIELAAY